MKVLPLIEYLLGKQRLFSCYTLNKTIIFAPILERIAI